MYIMYVDESGDTGLSNSPTKYYILTGIVIHELRWKQYLDQLINFRTRMLHTYGLHLREEIHAYDFISSPGNFARIKKNDRLTILRSLTNELSIMTDINIINILVDKNNKAANYDVFTNAWKTLLQRFENTIAYRNFPGPVNPEDKGIIIADATDTKKLRALIRQMRKYNPIPHNRIYGNGYRNTPLQYIIEDPNFRDSRDSYFIQAADVVAYLLYQKVIPNHYMRKKSGQNYFNRLDPVLCKVAAANDPQGIVRI